eukprot:6027582-Prymnesium_polylepis.1
MAPIPTVMEMDPPPIPVELAPNQVPPGVHVALRKHRSSQTTWARAHSCLRRRQRLRSSKKGGPTSS